MDFSLKGKVAVVTGGSGLIGKYHCLALRDQGARVFLADINKEAGERVAKETETEFLELNVADQASVKRSLAEVIEKAGQCDILVNNAAINDHFENPNTAFELSMFENYPLDMWNKMMNVNVTGMFLMCQEYGKHMAERGDGKIINVASTYGVVAPDQNLYKDKDGNQTFYKSPAYPITKHAVIGMTKFVAAYWGHKGVRVNTLTPGGVETSQDPYFIEKYAERTPLGRMAKADDYQGALVYLASDASKYVTGANIIVDGGWTIC